jgi:hypothetical protein
MVSFTAGPIYPGTHSIGGGVEPRAGLKVMEKKSYTYWESNPRRPVRHRRYTDSTILTHIADRDCAVINLYDTGLYESNIILTGGA